MKIVKKRNYPTDQELNTLFKFFQSNNFIEAEKIAKLLTQKFPNNQILWKLLGEIFRITRRNYEALNAYGKAVDLSPEDAESFNNLGVIYLDIGNLKNAEKNLKKAIFLKSNYHEAFNNLGNTLKEMGKYKEAEKTYKRAIKLNSNFYQAYNNLGVSYQLMGKLDEARVYLKKAISINSNFADTYWNLSGTERNINDAEKWIDKCLKSNENHTKARLTKAALRVYQGDNRYLDALINSELKDHPMMRSFLWVFSLPKLPILFFDKWHFFDEIIKKSITSRPFYEFGVWRANSFNYLIKFLKKGYGFDTFTGLPEDWYAGEKLVHRQGSYSNDGIIPEIKGAEFIKGKFEDTLPSFFSKKRPKASIINFDSDLYSSTMVALNYSKSVIDKDTILIFDEFIINESWEDDEFRALNDFCALNNLSYDVLAVSFLTKQVAVKLKFKL